MKKKICIVVPSLKKGGLERVASVLCNEICKMGFDVSIIIIIPSLNIDYEIDKNIKIYSPKFAYSKGFFFKVRSFVFLVKTLKKIKPSSVLAFSEVFNTFCILACSLINTKIFISDRSSPQKKLPFLDRFLKKITYPFASGIIAQTRLSKEKLIKYNKNIQIIPNPLKEINLSYERNSNLQTIVTVGRLVKTKNFEELVRIFSEIQNKDWSLIIVGDGPEYNNLKNLINNLKISKQVSLVGQQDDVDFYLSKASIFAYTSLSEGFPNVLNEAMAFPLSVISYDCIAGPSDMINNGHNGILVPLHDNENFKSNLELLMFNVDMRRKLQLNSVKNRELFSKSSIAKKIVEFIYY